MINNILRAVVPTVCLLLAVPVQAASVLFNTTSQSVTPGSSFTLQILGTDFPAMVGGGLNLDFNPAVLRIDSVSINTDVFEFYIGNGTEEGVLNNAAGTLRDTAFNTFLGATGDFTIMTIGFSAIGAGESLLSLSESSIWVFSDISGNAIGNQIQFMSSTIQVSAVPVPAAIWLFGSGLLLMMGCVRRK